VLPSTEELCESSWCSCKYSCFVFWRSRVRILAWNTAIVSGIFRVFPLSLSARKCLATTLKQLTIHSFRVFPYSLVTHR
jgi:hypothetical protein